MPRKQACLMFLYQTTINSSKRPHKTTKTKPTVTFNPQIEDPGLGLSDCVGPVNKYDAANTTKNPTIGRVSTVSVTVDTRPTSHMSF
jgi:hypothetical protein